MMKERLLEIKGDGKKAYSLEYLMDYAVEKNKMAEKEVKEMKEKLDKYSKERDTSFHNKEEILNRQQTQIKDLEFKVEQQRKELNEGTEQSQEQILSLQMKNRDLANQLHSLS